MDFKEEKEKVSPEDAEKFLKMSNEKKEMEVKTMVEKVKYVWSNITVEPALALFVMPSVLTLLGAQNLNLDKACRVDLNYTDRVCTDLRKRIRANHTLEEIAVQELLASVYTWKSVVHTAIPTIIMLFIGAWSDKTGKRKICMLMPIFGEFMTCVLNMTNTYFFYEVSVTWTVLMEVIMPALTGGWFTMFLGTFSYLGDITSKENRTFRMGVLNLCMTVGFPIGAGLSGLVLKKLGYYGVFGISALLLFLNFNYVFFFLEDHTWLDTRDKAKYNGGNGFVLEFFDVKSLRETVAVVFKKEKNNRRLKIILVLIGVFLSFGPLKGEHVVMYLFFRYKLNWDALKYGIYTAYYLIVHIIGTIFAITVLSKKFKINDAMLGILSSISKIAGAMVLAFAATDPVAYISPLCDILSGTAIIALRSIASKLVSYQELGKMYSLFGVAETFVPLVFESMYSRLYLVTFKVLPGAIFLFSVAVTLLALGIFGWFYRLHRRDIREQATHTTPPQLNENETVEALIVK